MMIKLVRYAAAAVLAVIGAVVCVFITGLALVMIAGGTWQ